MRRPPLPVVLIAVSMLALGTTAGAVMSQFRAETQRFALARIAANPAAHGLASAPEYDEEVRARTVFLAEAGLSFLHTHAEGLSPVVLLAASLVATAVPRRRLRAVLHGLLGVGALFPLGYLVYALAVLERGRDEGVALAETWVLTPLGTAAILGLVGLVLAFDRREPAP
ncbi:MAG TPA: hypothetical protein VNO23_11965 [Candidatus Binatia bacterium]|nr:hypothetical protein [Candidatus Binatia bacterium]